MDSTAGFVLTGGRGSRMGRDKRVRAAAGSLTLIAALERDAHLNLPAMAGLVPRLGQAAVKSATDDKQFKMHGLLRLIQAAPGSITDTRTLENVNTLLQWEAR